LFQISEYGRNIPLAEDWSLVHPLTGNEPEMLKWLWTQNNEHRIPVPKILLLGLLKFTNGDFRSGMYFNAFSLGILAFFMITLARKLRGGRTRFADAFFPVALLHVGNWENLVWSWQLGFVFPTVLTCAMLLLILNNTYFSKPANAIFAGSCVMLLPLSGANGLLYSPFLALWLFYCGILNFRNKLNVNRYFLISSILIISSLISIAFIFLYFIGFEFPPWYPHSPSIWATLITAAKFQALGLGPAVKTHWNVSAIIVSGFLLITAIISLRAIFRTSGVERHRALGISLFLGNAFFFAISVGWGRAAVVPTVGLQLRYVLLAAPALITAFYIWELYGLPRLRSAPQIGLLLFTLFLLPFNIKAGFEWRHWYKEGMDKVEAEILSGNPPSQIAERNREFLVHWWDETKITEAMLMLREAGIGPFSKMKGE
jgi:hypothetical protein